MGDRLYIESFRDFDEHCNEVELALRKANNDLSDMLTNSQAICSGVSTVNSTAYKLTRVSQKPQIVFDDSYQNNASIAAQLYTDAMITIIMGMDYYKDQIKHYNAEEGIIPFDEFYKNGDPEKVSDAYLKASRKVASEYGSAGSFLLAFTVETLNTDLDFDEQLQKWGVKGIGVGLNVLQKNFHKVKMVFQNKPVLWVNLAAGTFLSFGITLAVDLINDEGERTDLDEVRIGLDASSAAIQTLTWSEIFATAAAAGSGCPAVWAIGGAIVVGWVLGKFNEFLVGDNQVDEFTYTHSDGREETYIVFSNGNGKNGTYDVLYERCKKSLITTTDFAGNPVGSTNYVEQFKDFNWSEEYREAKTGCYLFDEDTSWIRDSFDQFLQTAVSFDNYEEAEEYYLTTYNFNRIADANIPEDFRYIAGSYTLMYQDIVAVLEEDCGFDFKAYYYAHKMKGE